MTGASSGIGAAVAELLAREGADVALLARGDGVATVAARVRAEGARAVELRADVTDRGALETAVERGAAELGGLDLVVAGAAAGGFGRFTEMPPEDFDRSVAITFGGAVSTIRAALPHLERSGGALVVLGSGADRVALPLLSPYVAAKHALAGFLGSLRAELRGQGSRVTVSVVRPGPVDSPFWGHLTHHGGLRPPAIPPLSSYTAASVARAVVACAIRPRRSVTVGGEMLLAQLATGPARPLLERCFALVARVGRGRARRGGFGDALWEPSGDGTVEGGLKGRPSLLAAARLLGSRPRGRVGG